MGQHLLEIKDLTIEYRSDESTVHAVNNVHLHLDKGKTLGLVGETGAGKTTLAKAILQILPERQTRYVSGEILFEGEDLRTVSDSRIREIRGAEISMIFQDPMTALNPTMKVGKQIEEAILLHEKVSRPKAKELAKEMLETIGIVAKRYDDYPHQFSGGMKQRVVIAIALACHPHLLLADEPTTALDVTIQAQVLDMINDLKKKFHTSVLFITHDLGIVAETCDDVAVMYAGEIVEYGTAEDIFDHRMHPYTMGLFGSIPRLNTTEKRLRPITGMMPDPTKVQEGCSFCDRCPFADEKCSKEKPELRTVDGSHLVRCFKQGVKYE